MALWRSERFARILENRLSKRTLRIRCSWGEIIDNGTVVFSHSLHLIVEIITVLVRQYNDSRTMLGYLPYPAEGFTFAFTSVHILCSATLERPLFPPPFVLSSLRTIYILSNINYCYSRAAIPITKHRGYRHANLSAARQYGDSRVTNQTLFELPASAHSVLCTGWSLIYRMITRDYRQTSVAWALEITY